MNSHHESIDELQNIIGSQDDPLASQLGALLDDIRICIEQREEEAQKQGEAQAAAIVYSAEIITELEETKDRLEATRQKAEAAADEARGLSAFGDILEKSRNEIYIFDCETFRFAHANQGALSNTGYTMEELSGLTPLDLKPEFSRESFQKLVAPTGQKKSTHFEFTTVHLRKNGSTYPVEVQLEESVFHNRPVYVAIIRDISYRHEMEAKNYQLQKELLIASRKAGMAEVATGVLHNVGNILNSVNVSTTLIKRRLAGSALGHLEKASLLIAENKSTFADFVRDDVRGQKLSQYLLNISKTLGEEREKIDLEFVDLEKNVEHIKEIVAVQQSMAKSFGVIQKLTAEELVHDVLTATKGSLSNHRVEVTKEFQEANIEFQSDRHKILQILINLVSNAKDAIVEHNVPNRKIWILVKSVNDSIVFSVTDNGIGIPADRITKIFQHGFTTKNSGHGFGLHSSANSATELGGSLTVVSNGIGTGAEFQLRISKSCEPGAIPEIAAPVVDYQSLNASTESSPV